MAVVLETHIVTDAGCHRHGADTGIANEGVDLLVLGQEEVHQLDEQHTAHGGDGEGKGSDGEDEDGVERQELAGLRGAAYGESQQHHDNVVQGATGGLGQTGGLATLLQQVAEEQHAQQGQTGRHDEGGEQEADDGEEDALGLTDLTAWLHLDDALFLGGEQSHEGRLDERHEGHVAIGADGDGSHEVRGQLGRQEDGGRTVGTTDDGDTGCLVGLEAKGQRQHVGTEDAKLGSAADEHQLGIGQQGREVGHGTDAQEDEWRIPALAHALVEDVEHGVVLIEAYLQSGIGTEGDITQDDTQSDGHQQQGLEVFLDGKIDEQGAYGYHDEVAHRGIGKACVGEKLVEVL